MLTPNIDSNKHQDKRRNNDASQVKTQALRPRSVLFWSVPATVFIQYREKEKQMHQSNWFHMHRSYN
jgi:hypothetical protein